MWPRIRRTRRASRKPEVTLTTHGYTVVASPALLKEAVFRISQVATLALVLLASLLACRNTRVAGLEERVAKSAADRADRQFVWTQPASPILLLNDVIRLVFKIRVSRSPDLRLAVIATRREAARVVGPGRASRLALCGADGEPLLSLLETRSLRRGLNLGELLNVARAPEDDGAGYRRVTTVGLPSKVNREVIAIC
jgi:hypothetical protein